MQFNVRQFIDWFAKELGITLRFDDWGVDEKAIVVKIGGDKSSGLKVGDVVVKIDPSLFRLLEVETLFGNHSKVKDKLGWVPEIPCKRCALKWFVKI